MRDEVKKKIQRAGGHVLFPYNVVRIVIRAAGTDGAVFEREFFRRFFDEELRKGLSKEMCRYPEDLRVEIRAVPGNGTTARPRPGCSTRPTSSWRASRCALVPSQR